MTKPTCQELTLRIKELEQENLKLKQAGRIPTELTERINEQELYSLLVEKAADGIWLLDKQFLTVFVNQALEEMLGYEKREMLGRSWEDFGDPAWVARAKELEKRREAGVKEPHEFLFVHKNGDKVLTRIATTPLYDAAGNFTGALGVLSDITRQKEAENALKIKEMLNSIAKSAGIGMAIINPDFTIAWYNHLYNKWLGGNEEIKGRNCFEVFQGREAICPECPSKMVFETGQTAETNISGITTSTGTNRILALTASPILDADGRALQVVEIVQDITERKNAEQRIKLFVELIDRSNDALFVVDFQTRHMIEVNEKLCRDLQYTRDELLAMRPEDISTKPAGFFDRHFRELRESETHLTEDYHRRKDGTTFPVEVNVRYTKLNSREFAVAIIRDISERKRMEQELQKAQRLESLGVLAGGIAHDFNNLLTAVQGNVSLAKHLIEGEGETFELLAEANAAAVQARDLTKQLLTFAKGGQPVKKTISLQELLTNTAGFVLRGSNVRCEFQIAEDLRHISGDEGQLCQVIHNLVLNADEAMPEGGTIWISAANEELSLGSTLTLEAGSYVCIQVQDEGMGILPEHLDKIFDPYFSTKNEGSGLGLASAYSVVRKHGGSLTVKSAIGRGTVFTLMLPAADQQAVAIQDKPQEIRLGKGRILVMDDEEHVRKIATRMLTSLGYQPENAEDGTQAMALYKQAREEGVPFDAVLMDLTIPGGMGGKQAIAELLLYDPEVKAIVSSGYTNDDLMANYTKYGFKGVVPKPYGLAELSQILGKVLGTTEEM